MFVFLSMSSLFTLLVFFTVVLYCTLVFVIAIVIIDVCMLSYVRLTCMNKTTTTTSLL